ncbi:hypothetical protein ABID22_000324 [Pontibacter aydingkolensis]|uniref:Outer membrane protein beta-barrel domain-containing protein n=1 Tax=Pontibacter aydingkolensis TaxID=1911536 RepID=A0ABS7CQA2_9BACT|nr:hypothetical protein [Pontibacter aydingkolensis]MBW7466010.1 hypothetical protein [Pontibacter aydingkolensis]
MRTKILLALLVTFFTYQVNAQAPKGQGIKAFLTASLLNKNVYKTKDKLEVSPVYAKKTGVSLEAFDVRDSYIVTPKMSPNPGSFIRYKELKSEGGYTYIKLLPGLAYEGNKIVRAGDRADPEIANLVFRVKDDALSPATHYLASSGILGKLLTVPLKLRKEEFNDGNVVLQGTPSIMYAFGWKLKLGNHPYKSSYISIIPYAIGISAQKHFSVKDSDAPYPQNLGEKTDEFALTYYAGGLALEFDNFNVGLFWGKDRMFGDRDNWVYQKKGWVGVGLGYDLFK